MKHLLSLLLALVASSALFTACVKDDNGYYHLSRIANYEYTGKAYNALHDATAQRDSLFYQTTFSWSASCDADWVTIDDNCRSAKFDSIAEIWRVYPIRFTLQENTDTAERKTYINIVVPYNKDYNISVPVYQTGIKKDAPSTDETKGDDTTSDDTEGGDGSGKVV